VPQASSLNNRALFELSHLKLFGTGSGEGRGSDEMSGVPYFVSGSRLISLDSSGVKTDHGFIEGAGRVSMANNGTKLCVVVPGGKAYVYDSSTSTLSEITDPDYRASDTVVFKDGYFVFTASAGDVFFVSNLNQPDVIDPLDFGTAEINPDKIIAGHVNHNELYICGEETIELFQNIGGSGFPFQRIEGANIQKGVHAKFSLVEFDNTFLFVGGGLNERSAVWRVTGSSSAQKVSTSAIDNAIQEFTQDEISNAFSMTYAEGGSFYAAFTFRSTRIPSKTFVYDATASALTGRSEWHERQSGITEDSWRANSIVRAHGKLLADDITTSNIGELTKGLYTEYGNTILRSKTSAPFDSQGLPLFEGEIALTMESGVGATSGQGSDPQIRMSFSDDGARTFSSEYSRSYGKVGEYESLPTWRRQGRIPRHRVLRFETSEPVKSVIIKLEANIDQGYQ
jgi:hypothetical protein